MITARFRPLDQLRERKGRLTPRRPARRRIGTTNATLPSPVDSSRVPRSPRLRGAGRKVRTGKKVGGQLVQGMLYQSALQPVAELDGSGAVKSTFVYANHANLPDYLVLGGVAYKLITDVLGSVRLVVNAQTGEVAQRIDYDEFGRVLTDSAPGFQPFGFAGGLYDPLTGLVRFGERDYDADTGRWTAKDPIRYRGGDPNLYAYVGNGPVHLIDPSGTIVAALAGGVAGGALIGGLVGAILGGVKAGVAGGDWSGVASSALSGGMVGALTGGLTGLGVVIPTAATYGPKSFSRSVIRWRGRRSCVSFAPASSRPSGSTSRSRRPAKKATVVDVRAPLAAGVSPTS